MSTLDSDNPKISIIIPAKNEGKSLSLLLPELIKTYPTAEIIVIDDGSTDDTAHIAKSCGAIVHHHPYSVGNGGAIKTGARIAQGDIFVFMDGDGQHQVADLALLFRKFKEGYDMVVGARNRQGQASFLRWLGNAIFNFLASYIVGHRVLDLTSGYRIVNAEKFKSFLHLLPNGFSTPSTITMAFFRTGFSVAYVPITINPRVGQSHLGAVTQHTFGLRFLLIIYKMTILYSPLKVFIPFAALHFIAGIGNYAYTYITQGRFTNMSAVFLSASVIIFLIGLVSEQITTLMYAQNSK